MNLHQGDTIGIIALSGNCDRDKVEKSKLFLESLGYKIKLSKNIFDENRYLAGSDEDKINELENFFKDPDIKLILASRGGYGAIRLVNKLNYELIKANPKPLCGYSDVTALLLMVYKKSGIITYHSPMACTDFANDTDKGTVNNFFDTINGKEFSYEASEVYLNGSAEGVLWGGNLATTCSLCGQDFIPDRNFIFFTEDINEPVYKIDRMFTQLLNIDKFRRHCKGIVLGEFIETDNAEWLNEFFIQTSIEYSFPMIKIYKITHGKQKITIPIGKFAKILGDKLLIE